MAKEKNLSVIMSLHELDLAERISSKIACVRGDQVDRFGTPEEIFSGGYISELYGMTVGSYEEITGNLELEPVKGIPQVFVIAGCGTGTQTFRRLQREGVPFATGILYENDLDFPSAKALASQIISVKPFAEIDEASLEKAKKVIRKCGKVICTMDLETAGQTGRKMKELLQNV